MATLNFPAQPQTIGNTYTFNNKTWVWNGQGWALTSELTNLTVTGNINTGNLISSGIVSAASFVGNISGNIDAAGSNTQVQFNDTGDILGASANFTFNKSTNVLSVTGTIQGTTLSATGNVIGGNITTTGLILATGNVTAGNLSGTNVTGTLLTAAQPNITSVGTLASLTVTNTTTVGNLSTAGTVNATGNITGGNLKTTNITINSDSIVSANSTITIDPSAAGATGLVVIAGNLQVQGTTTTIDSTTVTINDLMINVANNAATASQANLGGIGVGPAGSEYAKWIYNNTANAWTSDIGISVTGNITGGNLSVGTGTIDSGNILPAANVTYDLGSTSQRWKDLWLSNSSIYIGGAVVGAVDTTLTINGANVLVGNAGAAFSTSGNITGGNLLTSGLISATGNLVGGNLITTALVQGATVTATGNLVGGNANITLAVNSATVSASGNITGGNLSVSTGTVSVGNIVNTNANGVGNIGSATVYYNTVFAKATSAQYADVAEKYLADQDYAVGTVLVFGGDREVTQSTATHQTSIAGTVSKNPSYIMNAGLDGELVVTVALLGRVPVKVKGAISKGDLLVASSTPGVACRMDPARYSPGCVIGKALANHEENGPGWIEAVVGRI